LRNKRGRALADLHTLPERHVALDIGSRLFGLGVVPSGVRIQLTIDDERVIACLPFPRAAGFVIAKADELPVHGRLGKIMVAFDHDSGVALGDHGIFPNCFHADAPLAVRYACHTNVALARILARLVMKETLFCQKG